MRRTLALLTLLAVAAIWTGCSSYNSKPNTTTPERNNTTAAPAPPPSSGNTSPSNTSANRAPGGAPTGIKPPMKNDK